MEVGIIIGIDAGTSVLKSVAFSCDGRQLAMAAIANDYVTFPDGGRRAGYESHLGRCCDDAPTAG